MRFKCFGTVCGVWGAGAGEARGAAARLACPVQPLPGADSELSAAERRPARRGAGQRDHGATARSGRRSRTAPPAGWSTARWRTRSRPPATAATWARHFRCAMRWRWRRHGGPRLRVGDPPSRSCACRGSTAASPSRPGSSRGGRPGSRSTAAVSRRGCSPTCSPSALTGASPSIAAATCAWAGRLAGSRSLIPSADRRCTRSSSPTPRWRRAGSGAAAGSTPDRGRGRVAREGGRAQRAGRRGPRGFRTVEWSSWMTAAAASSQRLLQPGGEVARTRVA